MPTLYTAHATSTGGRHGHVETDDQHLKLELQGLDGPKKSGNTTNPEQLFACGYAACFGSALEAVARKHGVDAGKAEVTVSISLIKDDGGFGLGAELTVAIPGQDEETIQQLMEDAHRMCPYSKATRGNIDVKLLVAA